MTGTNPSQPSNPVGQDLARVLVSPVPFISAQPDDGTATAKDPPEQIGSDFPSKYICSFTQEPPLHGVTFNIVDENGISSEQVFERSALFRFIYTCGKFDSFRFVRHPTIGARIRRSEASSYISPVSEEIKSLLHQQRTRNYLSVKEEDEDDIITEKDHKAMAKMIKRMNDP